MLATELFNQAVVVDWRAQFAADLAREGRSANTVWAYLRDVQVFSRFYQQATSQPFSPDLLTAFDARAFRAWSLDVQRCAVATWNRRLASLRALAAWARENGHLAGDFDPLEGVAAVDEVQQAPRWLEPRDFARVMRQVEQAVNAANTDQRRQRAVRDAALVAVMMFAGLRESEAADLLRVDVDLSERKGALQVHGKGEKARRVPLSAEARRFLRAWLDLSAGERVFDLSARAIQKRVAELGQGAGVEELTPHALRHTFAKRLVDAGRPLTEVARLLGHSNLNTTKIYTQPGWSDLEEAVDSVALGKTKRS